MKPTWDKATVSNIKELLVPWESNLPRYPDINYQGYIATSADVYHSIESLIEVLGSLESIDVDAALYLVHRPGVNANLTGLLAALEQYVSNMGAQPYADAMVSHIWGTYSSLEHIHPRSDLLPSLFKFMESHEKKGTTAYGNLYKTAKDVIRSAEVLDSSVVKQLENSQKILAEAIQSVQDLKNLQVNAEATAVSIASTKTNVDEVLTNLGNVEEKGEELLDKLTSIRAQAEAALSSTTQVALAASFNNRKKSLENAQRRWILAFGFGLSIFFLTTVLSLVFQERFNLQPLILNGHVDAWGDVSRLLIMSPVIWFTWFSVKRYANNVPLIEDYAFKEASALAFVGYINNMQDDPEMIKLLRESAIKNFAYPPSRLIGGDNPTSPLDEAISSAMKDKGVFDRLIKLLQVLKPYK